MVDPCPRCGLDRALVGRVHRCVNRAAVSTAAANTPVVSTPVSTPAANTAPVSIDDRAELSSAEKRRAYQRELMRRRRAR